MAGADPSSSSEALDVARSELAAELRDPASVGFDAETAAGVVEALFSGAMDAHSVVEGLLGGDAKAAAAVSKFCSAVEKARRGGGGEGGASSSSSASSSASTYQPASLSAEASAARAREEASRSAAAAVAAVSTGALAAVPAGARAGRALVFKEAKPQAEKAGAEASSGGGGGKQALLGEKRILPADRRRANCLCCGKIYSFTRSSSPSADAEARRLLETGRCVFPGCGARVALRAGEVSDVRPAGRPSESPPPSASCPPSLAAAYVDDLARNPWFSSSERAAAIASAREAEPRAAAAAAAGGEEVVVGGGAAIMPAPGPRLLFSLPRRGNRDFEGKAVGSYSYQEDEEEGKQTIPGYYAPDEEASRAKGKGKKRGG